MNVLGRLLQRTIGGARGGWVWHIVLREGTKHGGGTSAGTDVGGLDLTGVEQVSSSGLSDCITGSAWYGIIKHIFYILNSLIEVHFARLKGMCLRNSPRIQFSVNLECCS